MLKELKEAVFKGKHDDNDLSNKNIHKDINYFLKRTKCKFQVERQNNWNENFTWRVQEQIWANKRNNR